MKVKDAPYIVQRIAKRFSKKQSVSVDFATEVSLYGNYWSGGTKHEYFAMAIEGMDFRELSGGQNGITGNPVPAIYSLKPGEVVVQAGIFCGKPATPHIYMHPVDFAKMHNIQPLQDDTPLGIVRDYFMENRIA